MGWQMDILRRNGALQQTQLLIPLWNWTLREAATFSSSQPCCLTNAYVKTIERGWSVCPNIISPIYIQYTVLKAAACKAFAIFFPVFSCFDQILKSHWAVPLDHSCM